MVGNIKANRRIKPIERLVIISSPSRSAPSLISMSLLYHPPLYSFIAAVFDRKYILQYQLYTKIGSCHWNHSQTNKKSCFCDYTNVTSNNYIYLNPNMARVRGGYWEAHFTFFHWKSPTLLRTLFKIIKKKPSRSKLYIFFCYLNNCLFRYDWLFF